MNYGENNNLKEDASLNRSVYVQTKRIQCVFLKVFIWRITYNLVKISWDIIEKLIINSNKFIFMFIIHIVYKTIWMKFAVIVKTFILLTSNFVDWHCIAHFWAEFCLSTERWGFHCFEQNFKVNILKRN